MATFFTADTHFGHANVLYTMKSNIKTLAEVQVGDTVNRDLCGIPMKLVVTKVADGLIYCGPEGTGWKFSQRNGAEIDEGLGWDERTTGSVITP
jgi:hypothetical protein